MAALQPLAHAAVPRLQSAYSSSPFQRLDIIFHGLSAIEFTSSEVHTYLPSGPSDYAYLAGTWMQEVTLSRGSEYRLSGVMTGPRPELRDIDPGQNVVYRARPIKPDFSFCKLVLPFPDFVTPLRLLRKEHGRNFLAGSPQPILEPSAIPQVVALGYVHPDSTSPLQFRPLDWTPVIMDGVVNLHIWDAPAKKPTPQEAMDAFTQLTKLIGAPGIHLDPAYAEIDRPLPDENPDVPGLGCQEEWSLVERLGDPKSCDKHRKRDRVKMPFDSLPLILY